MPLITYTNEDQIMQFMHDELGTVATDLEWESIAAPAYQQATNAVLRAGGNIATVDLIYPGRIELLARVEIWRRVVIHFMTAIDFSADGLNAKQGDLYDNAKDMLAMWLAEARKDGYYRGQDDATSTRHPIRFVF